MTNMIASADAATAIDGVSGALGGPADQLMFGALRSVADAIVVGASTVRAEQYRVPSNRALITVVTGRLDLDLDLPLFADPTYRPLIATVPGAPAEQRERLASVADVVDAGTDRVNMTAVMRLLADREATVALAEGGPRLNGQLVADDLIDEWNLSLAPLLGGGGSARPAIGDQPVHPGGNALDLARVWTRDDLLFCRWIRSRRA
ncbi:MAG: dihydrofolate reductase family protein [Actinomycetota bacterium]